jgi:hypothetical protein
MTIFYRLSLVFVFLFTTTQSQAQSNQDVDDVVSDLILLSKSYINPAAIGVSYQASAGWYTTATKKEQWHLELSLQGGVLALPDKFKTFSINQSQLKNLSVLSPDQNVTFPTSIGGTGISELEGSINGQGFRFDAPEGIDEDYVSQVQVQAALTVLEGTTLIGRFSPKVKIKETSYNTFGFGIHHNLSQWFGKEDSNFSLSALVAYSNFNVEDTFSNINVVIGNLNSVVVQGDSFTYQFTATQQINKFSISGGLGLISSTFNYEVGGDGDLILSILNDVLNNTSNSNSEFKGEVSLDYKISDFSINGMFTFGKFVNLTLVLNYNL